MGVLEMFQSELMDFELTVLTEAELFETVGEKLESLGYVTENYIAGLKERERVFPTGLMTQYLNIALPHGSPDNVIQPFVFIARLKEPIWVKQMGDGQKMLTKDFFFLGIADGRKQVGLLSALMDIFMEEDFVTAYKKTESCERVKQLLDDYLKKGVGENG